MPWLSLNTLEVLKNLLANIGFSMFNNFIINPLEIFNNHLWIICHVHFFISIIATSKIFLYLLLFYVSLIFSFSFAITYIYQGRSSDNKNLMVVSNPSLAIFLRKVSLLYIFFSTSLCFIVTYYYTTN